MHEIRCYIKSNHLTLSKRMVGPARGPSEPISSTCVFGPNADSTSDYFDPKQQNYKQPLIHLKKRIPQISRNIENAPLSCHFWWFWRSRRFWWSRRCWNSRCSWPQHPSSWCCDQIKAVPALGKHGGLWSSSASFWVFHHYQTFTTWGCCCAKHCTARRRLPFKVTLYPLLLLCQNKTCLQRTGGGYRLQQPSDPKEEGAGIEVDVWMDGPWCTKKQYRDFDKRWLSH